MTNFNFEVITLFPKAFELINNLGVITRALEKNLINVNVHDLREYGEGNYRQVDDKPYGGGSGMVLKPEPIYKAHYSIDKLPNSKTLLMTPQGKVLKQQDLLRWSSLDQLIIICGQYEGFDERVRCLADEEVSIGDFILSGGEIPAISIINGLTRLLPGTARSMRRMEKITGRSDDLIIIRGVNIFPTQVEEKILEVKELAPHFQIELSRKERLDEMLVGVELSKFGDSAKIQEYQQTLSENIKNSLGVSVKVVVSKEGSVARSEGKAVRVIDKRNL